MYYCYITRYAKEVNIFPCSDKGEGYYYYDVYPNIPFKIEEGDVDFSQKPQVIKFDIMEIAMQNLALKADYYKQLADKN